MLLSPHSRYKIRKAKQKKRTKKKPKTKQKQQQHSVWSPQKAAWGLRRCPFNSWPDTSLTHRQRTDISLWQQRPTRLHPELFLFLLTTGGGEKGTSVINALLKIIVRASLSTKAVIAHLYYTELFLISSFVVYLTIVN